MGYAVLFFIVNKCKSVGYYIFSLSLLGYFADKS